MYSVRGAITVENDNADEVLNSTMELLEMVIRKNSIQVQDIISIIFSGTKDLKSVYPAQAARNMGIVDAGLLCLQEMEVENSMKKCIRMLLHVNGEKEQKEVKHIFLREAVKLRPDIVQDFDEKY